MIEIESKIKYNLNSDIENKELLINGKSFNKLSITEKVKLWKVLSKYIELRIINGKSLSKDSACPYMFSEFIEGFIIHTGKYQKSIFDNKEDQQINFSLRIYNIWDDIKFFFKDLFKREKKNGGGV